MHPTSRILLRITPLSGPEISKQTLRLSPKASRPVESKKTTRETFNETAKQILAQKTISSEKLPDNLRIEVADKKKTMFWRVSEKWNSTECETLLTLLFVYDDLHRYPNPKGKPYVKFSEKIKNHSFCNNMYICIFTRIFYKTRSFDAIQIISCVQFSSKAIR